MYSSVCSEATFGAFHDRVVFRKLSESARDYNHNQLVYGVQECYGAIIATIIVGRLPTFTLPVTTSNAVIFSNLHNTFAPILTNYPYSAFAPKPLPTFYPTSTLPMTTYTPPPTSAIVPLAFPFRSWVMNHTPSYTVPTLPPCPTLPSLALPALFVNMISAPGPHTPHSNKL